METVINKWLDGLQRLLVAFVTSEQRLTAFIRTGSGTVGAVRWVLGVVDSPNDV